MRVAAIQIAGFQQYDCQMAKIEQLSSEASRSGATVICLPELMTTPYFARSQNLRWRDAAEPLLEGRTFPRIAALAKKLKCTIIGTCYESCGDRRYNTAFIVNPDGCLAGRYAKTHIPLIEAAQAYETLFFTPGEDLPVFDIGGTRVGILICYDRSFPEAWRTLALKGAGLIVVPTSSSGFRGGMYAEELKVAAAQNQVFVVAANKAGEECLPGEAGSITFYGKSCIINPLGEPIAVLEQQEDTFIIADLCIEAVTAARRRLDYYRDRRTDLYELKG